MSSPLKSMYRLKVGSGGWPGMGARARGWVGGQAGSEWGLGVWPSPHESASLRAISTLFAWLLVARRVPGGRPGSRDAGEPASQSAGQVGCRGAGQSAGKAACRLGRRVGCHKLNINQHLSYTCTNDGHFRAGGAVGQPCRRLGGQPGRLAARQVGVRAGDRAMGRDTVSILQYLSCPLFL